MFKNVIAALAAAPLFAGAAFAGPYVNVEANSSFTGGDYTGNTTEFALGYEGSNWFVQGGPIVNSPDGADGDTAYEVAVTNGFQGTEAEWLASLVGPQGPQGPHP